MAQLERAQTRLQDNLTLQTENSRAEEDLRDSRGQVAELNSMVDKLRAELTRLEKEHNTLRYRYITIFLLFHLCIALSFVQYN